MKEMILETKGVDYAFYRLPGLIVTKKGTLIFYCEARSDIGDLSQMDLIMRRSTDDGKTWSNKIVIKRIANAAVDNPVMISDDTTGDIHLIYCVNACECFYRKSVDDGITWTDETNITYAVEEFRQKFEWSKLGTGPGHGICTKSGRLILPIWFGSSRVIERSSKSDIVVVPEWQLERTVKDTAVSALYSDDNGKTWTCGGIIKSNHDVVSPNETSLAEMSDGSLLFNIRNESDWSERALSITQNEGETFSIPCLAVGLYDPACQGSMCHFESNGKNIILFCNCNTDRNKAAGFYETRRNLVIRCSKDDGKTWELIYELNDKGGYSDIYRNPMTGTIFVCYETGWQDGQIGNQPAHIALARLKYENDRMILA